MGSSFLADVIVAIHVAYVGFVVLAVPAILVGGLTKAKWVRNSWFRNIHLLMIGIVVVEALLGIACPLTVWESDLRIAAGEEGHTRSFVGELLHGVLFYDFEPWVFTVGYCVFGAVVIALYWMYPPNWINRASAGRTR